MEIIINELIEFSENKADYVNLVGNVCTYPQDGTFLEDIFWDKGKYTKEENDLIAQVARKKSDKFFDLYNEEVQERLLENNI